MHHFLYFNATVPYTIVLFRYKNCLLAGYKNKNSVLEFYDVAIHYKKC